jgi:hypothetical protein
LQRKHIVSIENTASTNLVSKVSTIMSSVAAPRQQPPPASGGPSNVQRAGRSPCFVASYDASPILPQIPSLLAGQRHWGHWRPRSQWYVVRRGRRAALPRAQQPAAPRRWTKKILLQTYDQLDKQKNNVNDI